MSAGVLPLFSCLSPILSFHIDGHTHVCHIVTCPCLHLTHNNLYDPHLANLCAREPQSTHITNPTGHLSCWDTSIITLFTSPLLPSWPLLGHCGHILWIHALPHDLPFAVIMPAKSQGITIQHTHPPFVSLDHYLIPHVMT